MKKTYNNPIRQASFLLSLFLFSSALIQSCNKDENKDTKDPGLVNYEKVSTISAQTVQLSFAYLAVLYPELANVPFASAKGVDIYKVKYNTTFKNQFITASGIVCVPQGNGRYPVLSFQNGTNTSNTDAPSLNYGDSQFALLENIAGLGFIVAIPDYIGFGESNNILHPYYHRASSDSAVIGLINASKALVNDTAIGGSTNGKLFLAGYSQGGWATLSALKSLEAHNSTGLEPVGASCGAGAYNLPTIASYILHLNRYGTPAYLPYFIESHQRNGLLNTNLDLYFKKQYADVIPGLFDGNHYIGTINSSLTDSVPGLVTQEMLANFTSGDAFKPLRDELQNNSVEPWLSNSKILLVHGKDDDVVPVSQSEYLYSAFKTAGMSDENIQLNTLDGKDHSSGVLPWGIKTIVWLEALQ